MNFIYKKLSIISVFSFLLLFLAMPAFASSTYFGSESNEVSLGQSFKVDFFLNTEGQNINALEGRVVFPPENLELVQTTEGGSIVSFWVEKPELKSENWIVFSGGLPGGFTGDKGLIFSMVFRVKDKISAGEIKLFAENLKVFPNDGSGTEVAVSPTSFSFNVTDGKKADVEIAKDTESPESFIPYIGRNPTVYNNRWFAAFIAQDKESGIDHYEVWESPQKYDINKASSFTGAEWEKAESPYLLKDQKLQSYVYVKAVDKAGNERVEMLLPGKSKNSLNYKNMLVISAVVLLIVLATLFAYKILINRKKGV